MNKGWEAIELMASLQRIHLQPDATYIWCQSILKAYYRAQH